MVSVKNFRSQSITRQDSASKKTSQDAVPGLWTRMIRKMKTPFQTTPSKNTRLPQFPVTGLSLGEGAGCQYSSLCSQLLELRLSLRHEDDSGGLLLSGHHY
ncbi:uncharacterized protein LOC104868943 isoform X1 [Fukomys damarensis]|uniref:uncharacterized protein LOC104868943 isoform X1 n=1 Tax=Fukomys damarensis TaxID=885580 RepID=UPI00053F8F23|nr:uncharacterized protein LOC104868943 isoform X1 [Fukomys damarensis]